MQRPHLKLREIIWEITGRCENHCSYCGSKEVWKEEIDEPAILAIAAEIAKYPPEEITISGGDPLLVDYEIHATLVQVLKDAGVEVKILFNPKSLKYKKNILSLYDWCGVSINTQEELELAAKYITNNDFTVVTNFNLSNIFLYDKIESYVRNKNVAWQIQYTIYKNKDDERALYNNDDAKKHLEEKISNSLSSYIPTKIIFADNMNNSPCGAGLCSIGITSNGDIVPCLSMRSWASDMDIQGNILETNLQSIWEEKFIKQRFCEFECCKDYCKNKVLKIKVNKDEIVRQNPNGTVTTEENPFEREFPIEEPNIMIYGVYPDRQTLVYGVGTGARRVIVYAVTTSNSTKTKIDEDE